MKKIILAVAAVVVSISTAQAADKAGFGLDKLNADNVSRMEAPAIPLPIPVKADEQKSGAEIYLTCSGENGQEILQGLFSADAITAIQLASDYTAVKDGKLERVTRNDEKAPASIEYRDSITTLLLATGMDSGQFGASLEQKRGNDKNKVQLACRMNTANAGITGVQDKPKLPSPNLTAELPKPGLTIGDLARVQFGIGFNPGIIAGPNSVVGAGFDLGRVVSLQLFPKSPVGLQLNLQPGGYWGSGEVRQGVTTETLYDDPEYAIMDNQWEWVTDSDNIDGYHVDMGWIRPYSTPVTLDHYAVEERGGTRTRSNVSYYSLGNALVTYSANLANDLKVTFFGGVGLGYRNVSNYTEGYRRITQTDDYIHTYTEYDALVNQTTYTDYDGNSSTENNYDDIRRSEVRTLTQTVLDESLGVTHRQSRSGFVPSLMAGATAMLSDRMTLDFSASRIMAPDVESRLWKFSVGVSLKF